MVEQYDTDKMFPLFGFGGIPTYMGATQVSHCFNLNGQPSPEVPGISGVFTTYQNSIRNTTLSGPTYFAQVLSNMV